MIWKLQPGITFKCCREDIPFMLGKLCMLYTDFVGKTLFQKLILPRRLLYKGYEFFVENTPQVHSSMKTSILFDRFTNTSKSIVSSIFLSKTPESLKKYRGIIKQLDYCSIRTPYTILFLRNPSISVCMERCTLWFEICILKDIDTDLATIFYLY